MVRQVDILLKFAEWFLGAQCTKASNVGHWFQLFGTDIQEKDYTSYPYSWI